MALHIHELNHITIHVTDLERSIDFYERVLGLRRASRPTFDFPGAWFDLGRQQLHLIGNPQLSPATRSHHHFAIWVDDPIAAGRDLQAKGWTKVRPPQPRPDGVTQVFVTDPDGYIIELMSAPPGRT